MLPCFRAKTLLWFWAKNSFFLFSDLELGFDHGIGIERNAVNALLYQELREIGEVAGRLAADPYFFVMVFGFLDHGFDEAFDRRVAFVV